MSARFITWDGAHRSGGFTLVELAIVIAIIGVLASTAGVQYTRFLDRARSARAIVELRGIAKQIEKMGDDKAVLPESLAAVGLATDDPWGNPYQYLKIEGGLPPGMSAVSDGLPHVAAPGSNGGGGDGGGDGGGNGGGNTGGGGGGPSTIALARKDRFLVPINSDFDLYSSGPDGQSMPTLNATVSRDDIVRAADGAFYGVAASF